jgi:hypothetical protein
MLSLATSFVLLVVPASCLPVDMWDVAKGGWNALDWIKNQLKALAEALKDYHDELFWVFVVAIGLLTLYFCWKMLRGILLCLLLVALVFIAVTIFPNVSF